MKMKHSHFCPQHRERLRHSETQALAAWNEVMRRGVQAYSACRVDAARIYLGSATEIALLRLSSLRNVCFEDTHLLKPLEFMVEVLALEERFDEAIALLSTISSSLVSQHSGPSPAVEEALAEHYQRIEQAEKRHFISDGPLQKLRPRQTATSALQH